MKRIASPWILQETEKIDNLDAFLAGLQESAQEWPYTAAGSTASRAAGTWDAAF